MKIHPEKLEATVCLEALCTFLIELQLLNRASVFNPGTSTMKVRVDGSNLASAPQRPQTCLPWLSVSLSFPFASTKNHWPFSGFQQNRSGSPSNPCSNDIGFTHRRGEPPNELPSSTCVLFVEWFCDRRFLEFRAARDAAPRFHSTFDAAFILLTPRRTRPTIVRPRRYMFTSLARVGDSSWIASITSNCNSTERVWISF